MRALMGKMMLLVDGMRLLEDRPLAIQEFSILALTGEDPFQVALAGAALERAGLLLGTMCDCEEGCETRFVTLSEKGQEIVRELKAGIREETGVDLDNIESVEAAARARIEEKIALGQPLDPIERDAAERFGINPSEAKSAEPDFDLDNPALRRSSFNLGNNPNLN
jgi:hypothetical protein